MHICVLLFICFLKIKYYLHRKNINSKEKSCCMIGFSISVEAIICSRFLKIIQLFFMMF